MPDALWAGILAGYAIAIPVGPIAILIFDTALRRGIRIGAAAGAGAASADGFYATVAGLVGAAVAGLLSPVIVPGRILAAALLVLIATRGLIAAVAVARHDHAADRVRDDDIRGRSSGVLGTYLLFLGLDREPDDVPLLRRAHAGPVRRDGE